MQDFDNSAGHYETRFLPAECAELLEKLVGKLELVELAQAMRDNKFTLNPGESDLETLDRARCLITLQAIAMRLERSDIDLSNFLSVLDSPVRFREQVIDAIYALEDDCIDKAEVFCDDLRYALESAAIGFCLPSSDQESVEIARLQVAAYRDLSLIFDALERIRFCLDFSEQDIDLPQLPEDIIGLFPEAYDPQLNDSTNIHVLAV